MNQRLWNRSLMLTALAVAVISCLTVWFAWQSTTDLFTRLFSFALAPVLAAATISYGLRLVRFHYFLKRSGVAISLRSTAVVQSVGFALSVTPAHIGEVFKLHLVRERAGTPVIQTAPLLLLDRVTEGGGFIILAAASALALPALRDRMPAPVALVSGLAGMLLFGLVRTHNWSVVRPAMVPLENTEIWKRVAPHLQNLWRGLQSSFTPRQILGGLALSAVARFADGLVLLFAARLLGQDLSLPAAVFVLAVSGLAGGISLLPAGTGAVETTMTGLLVLSGLNLTNALTLTLLARLATLWLWVALGLVVAVVVQLSRRGVAAGERHAVME